MRLSTLLLLVPLAMGACRCTPEPPPPPPGPTSVRLVAEDMAGCMRCALELRADLMRLPSLHVDKVAVGSGKVEITYDPSATDLDAILKASELAGYRARALAPDDPDPPMLFEAEGVPVGADTDAGEPDGGSGRKVGADAAEAPDTDVPGGADGDGADSSDADAP